MQKQNRLARAVLAASLFTLFGSVTASAQTAPSLYQAAIDSPVRSEADRKNDAKRKPDEFLAFARVGPGMKALDIGAGAGATAVLLAVAVTPGGEVWAHNSWLWPELDARVAGGALPNLRLLLGPTDNPIPKNLPPLDLITMNMAYHDIATFLADRTAMNLRLYKALKPGGYLVVVDNAAKPGSGVSETGTLHRIDEDTVVAEMTQAGFTVDARSDYLRAPSDPRELPYFKMAGAPDDKFAIRFVKK
jgi:predicted methyltransferase